MGDGRAVRRRVGNARSRASRHAAGRRPRGRAGGRGGAARRGGGRSDPQSAGRRSASGSACPGCTTPWPARRGSSSTSPVRGPVRPSPVRSAKRSACRSSLSTTRRAFGLAELRLGAGRGASSMVGLTLGTGVGGVIAIDGRVHQGHDGTARRDRPPDDRSRRATMRLREPRLRRGVCPGRPNRGSLRNRNGRGSRGARAGR